MFTFPAEPGEIFAERSRQFEGWGIPASTVSRVRSRVRDMWSDGPEGWTAAWAEEAVAAEGADEWLLASLLWGAAKFPSLATPAREIAYERQLAAFENAANSFPVAFRRLDLTATFRGESTPVAVHLYRRRRAGARWLLVLCSGVDTWKVEVHRIATAFALCTRATIAVLDMPGTGESETSLAPDSDEVFRHVIADLRRGLQLSRAGFLGISFGGHWAAKLALTGAVDAAVAIGGPVGATEIGVLDVSHLPNGMPGILGNAMGMDRPDDAGVADRLAEFSLRQQGLLSHAGRSPLLAVNGDRDQYIPIEDTTVFRAHCNADVWVIETATHVAAERIERVLPAALAWLAARVNGETTRHRLMEGAMTLQLRPLLKAS